MYPSEADPDFGIFVKQIADSLADLGHEIEFAVIDHRGGSKLKHARLLLTALRGAVRFRPDVVYAHFLVPAGLVGAAAATTSRSPLVVMAHGRDVRNVGSVPGVGLATRAVARRSYSLVANSDFLRRELEAPLKGIECPVEVIDSGVDLETFHGGDAAAARARLGWEGRGPFFVFVGSVDERKNVRRLVEAFSSMGDGQLALVGDGPLRSQFGSVSGVRLVGRISRRDVSEWMTAADVVCLPSVVEPFGQVLLEALACERSVVATRVGGPPEFVTREVGALVDPLDTASIADGLARAAGLPRPNRAARAVAREHDVAVQAGRVADLLRRAITAHGA